MRPSSLLPLHTPDTTAPNRGRRRRRAYFQLSRLYKNSTLLSAAHTRQQMTGTPLQSCLSNMSKIEGKRTAGAVVRIGCAYPVPGVENNGFEPLTPCLQSRCSSQLS